MLVGQMQAGGFQPVADGAEQLELVQGEGTVVRLAGVGGGEMGESAVGFQTGQAGDFEQLGDGRFGLSRLKADALHTGVEREMHL